MKRAISLTIRASLILAMAAATLAVLCTPAAAVEKTDGETLHFLDDFDGYAPGTLPPGWDVVWWGAGHESQVVSDARSASGANSFHLLGRRSWSAVVQRHFAAEDSVIGFEFKILIESVGSRGEEHPGFFRYRAEGNRWGTYYGTVRFEHSRQLVLAEDGTVLGAWNPGTWYQVRVLLDRPNTSYDVWLDGSQVGFDLPTSAEKPELVNALALVSGHAGVAVYYDDVSVFVPGGDMDGDGIPDDIDPCPEVDPGLIDLNVDGCIDTNFDIAIYLKEGLSPFVSELPEPALDCAETAIVDLEVAQFEASLEDMLCVTTNLEGVGTQSAVDSAIVTGTAAQTTALLAIEEQAQIVGYDDPNVVAASTIVEIGIDLLGQFMVVDAVTTFLDAILQLTEDPEPAILVEVEKRGTLDSVWLKNDSTFAAWGEYVHWPIRVTNVGNVDLAGVKASQTCSGYEKVIGVLGVGESRIVNTDLTWRSSSYRVAEGDPDPFIVVSSAIGYYKGQAVKDAAWSEVDIIHPSLKLTVEAPESVTVGKIAKFGFTVTNTGDVVLHRVTLRSPWPIGFFEEFGDLAPGESQYVPIYWLVPNIRRDQVGVWATALGSRDYDTGFSWALGGRRIDDSKWFQVKVLRP